jgi:hypothetical protein
MKTLNVLSAIAILLVVSCSILKKEDNDKAIRDFLLKFQNTLNLEEQAIIAQFDISQSKEALLSAIAVLQNKAHEFILCEPAYGMADIKIEEGSIQVSIPVAFKSQKLDEEFAKSSSIIMWLKPKKGSYVISKLEAEEFYRTFAQLKSEMEWQVERKREFAARDAIYGVIRSLENNFDSVAWYSRYGEKYYLYVVSGEWLNWFEVYDAKRPAMTAKVGLASESGEVIIPMEYDLIGTIGFDFPSIVEVHKEGKVGYFNIETGKLVIPAEYDMIIPYERGNVKCIVKSDSIYGWYNKDFVLTTGFPDENAERWIRQFNFIPINLHIDIDDYALAEIPHSDQAGNGIVVMPSYLSKTGVFKEVISGISPTDFPMNGYTDYVETQSSVLQSITESMSGLITTIRERYLDGREEFYTHNNLVLVGTKQDTLAVARLYSSGSVVFTVIDSLLEVKSLPDGGYFEGEEWEANIPQYSYFRIDDGVKAKRLKSVRNFPMTEFVKLDSSYLSGVFSYYNPETEKTEDTEFLSLNTITYMRNEILASYGQRFINKDGYNEFPHYEKVEEKPADEVLKLLSDIDAHNVRFLERVISLMQTSKTV